MTSFSGFSVSDAFSAYQAAASFVQAGKAISDDYAKIKDDLTAMKVDLVELKKESVIGMYCGGIKRKLNQSPREALSSVARVTLTSVFALTVTAGVGYCTYNGYFPVSLPSSSTMNFLLRRKMVDTALVVFTGAAAACRSFRRNLEKEVANNIVHGYYDRVSQIVDQRIGSRLSDESKNELKQQISKKLGNTPIAQIESEVLGLITDIGLLLKDYS